MSFVIWEENFNKNASKDNYNNFFMKVVETSHDEIYVCDKEGRTIYCNKTFEKNYGIKREDMLGKTAMSLVENGYSDNTPITHVIKYKKAFSLEQKTATGRKLIITATPFFDENGEIEFIVENCRDITELAKIKDELKYKNKELERYKAEINNIRKNNKLKNHLITFKNPQMKKIQEDISKISKVNVTLLIHGESGTGKTQIAKLIHNLSDRSNSPFISINCSTIPSTLFESELFGYESGAFTGAKSKGKIGFIELANGGTVFLDEIGEMPYEVQSKLLEFIQEKKFTPVGSVKNKFADVRIITATNRNLLQMVSNKTFREDLYYRINVVNIKMPSIRERKEDIKTFVNHFLKMYNEEYNTHKKISEDALTHLENYNWPGNIREIQNLIQNLVIMTQDDLILSADLPQSIFFKENSIEDDTEVFDFDKIIYEYEKAIVQRCFNKNKSSYKLAKALNITQSKAMRLIKKYNLNKNKAVLK